MSNDNRIDVDHLAGLARLTLADGEREQFAREIAAIVDYVALLSEADVSGVEPMAHAAPITNVVAADVEGETIGADVVLANAPAVFDGEYIRVPAVLGDDDAGSA